MNSPRQLSELTDIRGPRVLSIFRVLAEYSLQRAFTRRLCAQIVPEVVGSGDLSDLADCGISNLRVCSSV